jgi:ABC-type lipoprotein release transport system permease subunit
LYGVQPYDAWSCALAVLGVVLVALIVSVTPGAEAASVDPLAALRTE